MTSSTLNLEDLTLENLLRSLEQGSQDPIQEMSHPLVDLAQAARSCGIPIRLFINESQIAQIPASQLYRAAVEIKQYLELIRASDIDLGSGKQPDIHSERKLFRYSLKSLNLRTVDDFESKIESGDIVEIYDKNFIQVYRNPVFFRFCSYDLFTLYTEPFFKLYSRPEKYNQAILNLGKSILESGESTQPFDVEPHFLKEIFLGNKKLFKVHPKWISPLVDTDSQEVRAIVLTNYCIEHEMRDVN